VDDSKLPCRSEALSMTKIRTGKFIKIGRSINNRSFVKINSRFVPRRDSGHDGYSVCLSEK
jgi:hypothetical protein